MINRSRIFFNVLMASAALVLLGGAATASAPPAKGRSPSGSVPPAASQPGGGILAGPSVEPDAADRTGPAMSRKGEERREPDVPFVQWVGVLRGLGLSTEQQAKVRAISEEFQQAQRDYMAAQPENVRDLMRQVREARQNGGQPPAEARETLKKFEENRPKPETYQVRIWDELTEAQQAQMKAKLDQMIAERAKRQHEKQAAGQGDGKRPSDPPKTRRPGAPADPGAAGKPMLQDDPGTMMGDQPAPTATTRPAANGGRASPKRLDAMARRRLEFLTAHQAGNHINGQPKPSEREFTFEDDPANSARKPQEITPTPTSP